MQSHKELIVDGVGLDPETLPKPINWPSLFGNANPVELEIGIGKGTFLTDQAKARPDTNFFGIEWARWFWRYASDRLRRNHCTNARTVRAEAAFFLREHVPDSSPQRPAHLFPRPLAQSAPPPPPIDPTRVYAPRRAASLCPAGALQVVTDHLDYWTHIEPTVRASNLKVIDYTKPDSAAEGEFVGTNFERKYRREGRPFYAIAAVK